ncbi:MAG: winged helix-turn-helix domain-containing protein [Thermoanaerobaculia bacterium]
MENLSLVAARRLALCRAGLLKPALVGCPQRAKGRGMRARAAALRVLDNFGYLQLDTVSIAGARSHTIVLLSRLEGLDPVLGEELLQPGQPVFEYWGHEASWIPMDLYPAFEFRRREFLGRHPWWGNVVARNRAVAQRLRARIREQGPLRSIDMEGKGSSGWWDLKVAKRVALALWSSGELAIRERKNFQKTYDLAERVIPETVRGRPLGKRDALEVLLLKALDGHGWALTGTLAQTWRLANRKREITAALERLVAREEVVACALENPVGRPSVGWIRPRDLELAEGLMRARPRANRGVLLSPFDPVLWDRVRVQRLFGFEQMLEIFKPAAKRKYGYYCLPVLAGERLVARFDFKADRKKGVLNVMSCRFEATDTARSESTADREAARTALVRYSNALELKPVGWR